VRPPERRRPGHQAALQVRGRATLDGKQDQPVGDPPGTAVLRLRPDDGRPHRAVVPAAAAGPGLGGRAASMSPEAPAGEAERRYQALAEELSVSSGVTPGQMFGMPTLKAGSK